MSALAQRHLRGLYPKLQTVTLRLKKRWERLADAGASLDVVEELKRFTVDVTTLVAFGHDVNTVEQGDDVIQRKLEFVLPEFNRRLFALFPTWRFVRLQSLDLKVSSNEPVRFQVASTVRSLAFRMRCFSLAKTCSMGLRSGE